MHFLLKLLILILMPFGLVTANFALNVLKYQFNKRKYKGLVTFCHKGQASFFKLHSDAGGAIEMQKEAFDHVNKQFYDLTHQGMDQDGMNMIGLAHPDDIQLALTHHDDFVKPDLFDKVRLSFGNGLAVSAGADWRRQKQLLEPVFTPEAMRQIFPIMVSATQQCVDVLLRARANINGAGQQPVDVIKYFSDALWEVQLATFFRGHQEEKVKLVHHFAAINKAIMPVFIMRVVLGKLDFLLKPFGLEKKAKLERQAIDHILAKIVKEKRESSSSSREPEDLLSAMMETQLTDQEIFDNFMTLNFGAHETTTNQLAWCVYFLAKHPHYLTKLRQYLLDHQFSLDHITAEQLESLPFLTHVVKEAARLMPITNANGRRMTKDTKMANGVVLPKDTIVNLMAGYVHNDPRFWERPQDFWPERWEDGTQRHPFVYFNFSGGPRVCIGELYAWHVMRLFVATIALRFDIDANVDNVQIDTSALTSPKGLMATFTPLHA